MAVALAEIDKRLGEVEAAPIYYQVIERLKSKFPEVHDVNIVRAPGRVNVIGEHTDYNGLPVFPMALDREIVIAFGPAEPGVVELVNLEPSYPEVNFRISGDIPHYDMGHWGNYIKAAAQAAHEWAEGRDKSLLPLNGIRGVVGGSIPPGSGLSSSSALVVAAAVALMMGLPIEKPELADLLAKGEHYVGTQGGGMDQAASLLNKRGYALKIDFAPLRTRPVKLPDEHVIIVANTMVSAKKTGGARDAYNTRVAECRLGLSMLKHDAQERDPEVEHAELLRDFMDAVPDWQEFIDALPDGAMGLDQIASYVGTSEQDLTQTCLVRRDGTLLPVPEAGFQPKKRCRHVLTEGARVELAAEASENGDAEELGRLMDESHASCADDYEISCPELDELVKTLRSAGALGARLTGAGFGGCTVSLVHASKAQELTDMVWESYYKTYLPGICIETPADRGAVLFACSPAEGAEVLIS